MYFSSPGLCQCQDWAGLSLAVFFIQNWWKHSNIKLITPQKAASHVDFYATFFTVCSVWTSNAKSLFWGLFCPSCRAHLNAHKREKLLSCCWQSFWGFTLDNWIWKVRANLWSDAPLILSCKLSEVRPSRQTVLCSSAAHLFALDESIQRTIRGYEKHSAQYQIHLERAAPGKLKLEKMFNVTAENK